MSTYLFEQLAAASRIDPAGPLKVAAPALAEGPSFESHFRAADTNRPGDSSPSRSSLSSPSSTDDPRSDAPDPADGEPEQEEDRTRRPEENESTDKTSEPGDDESADDVTAVGNGNAAKAEQAEESAPSNDDAEITLALRGLAADADDKQAPTGGRESAGQTNTVVADLALDDRSAAKAGGETSEAAGESAASDHAAGVAANGAAAVKGAIADEQIAAAQAKENNADSHGDGTSPAATSNPRAKSRPSGKGQTGDGRGEPRLENGPHRSAESAVAKSAAASAIVESNAASSTADRADQAAARSADAAPQSPAPPASPTGGESGGAVNRLSQHLVSRGKQGEPRPELRETDQSRFLHRVARAFETARERGGEIRLRLSPPELGSLKLEVKLQGGALSAHIEADTQQARTLLLDNLPLLRERLAEQNIRIEQFDVDLADRRSGGTPDDPHDARQQTPGEPAPQPRSQRDSSDVDDDAANGAARFRPGSSQLNVIV
jgi:flagellar hook-length control protein FliK